MILPTTWQFIRRYPYLFPFLVIILLLVALGHVVAFCKGIVKAGNCPDCDEGKGLCLVACERVQRRLDEADQAIERAEAKRAQHPCKGCEEYYYGCDGICSVLSRWELGHL